MRRVPKQHPNFNVRRERDPSVLQRQTLLVVAGLVLVTGFVVAARQQFVAVEYGYRSEELRRERERLLEEQKRLLLSLEESSSPARLERAARSLGLQPTRPAQIRMRGQGSEASAPHAAPAFVGSAAGGAALRP